MLSHELMIAADAFTATDAEWSAGDGPTVSGPIEGLVLALSGRLVGLEQLHGEGMAVVTGRAAQL